MLTHIVVAGLLALQDYVAAHVLTCLVPAFLLAGAMVSFVDQELVLDYLGEQANKLKSFSLASGSSFLLAACSCTVIPVASGLYFAGAGVGVAFIILWVAPSANVLALVYTGNILGMEMVLSRVAGALFMALLVGYVMSYTFRSERLESIAPQPTTSGKAIITRQQLTLILLILSSLLFPNYFVAGGPYLLKVSIWALCTIVTGVYALRAFSRDEINGWLRETWWFVRTIFPLLLGGVFLVGVIGALLPEEWVNRYLGGNSLQASFLATLLGSVTYFATMTEAPFVDTLLGMGMGKGPALALLLTGPGLSLPNWLAISRIFGIKKALVYVPLVIFSGTLVGWFFGNFIL